MFLRLTEVNKLGDGLRVWRLEVGELEVRQ